MYRLFQVSTLSGRINANEYAAGCACVSHRVRGCRWNVKTGGRQKSLLREVNEWDSCGTIRYWNVNKYKKPLNHTRLVSNRSLLIDGILHTLKIQLRIVSTRMKTAEPVYDRKRYEIYMLYVSGGSHLSFFIHWSWHKGMARRRSYY